MLKYINVLCFCVGSAFLWGFCFASSTNIHLFVDKPDKMNIFSTKTGDFVEKAGKTQHISTKTGVFMDKPIK